MPARPPAAGCCCCCRQLLLRKHFKRIEPRNHDDMTGNAIRKRAGRVPAALSQESRSNAGSVPAVSGCDKDSEMDSNDSNISANTTASKASRLSTSASGTYSNTSLFNRLTYIAAGIISVAVLCIVTWGFILRTSFHHGKECDMTYSRFKFLPLEVSNYNPSASARPYRLLKFVDARDPRNTHLWNVDGDSFNSHADGIKVHSVENNWCLLPESNYTRSLGMNDVPYPNPGHPVLFVPGHWGEYKQARSLGAHGARFTRKAHSGQYQQEVARKLMDGTFNGRLGDENNGIHNSIYDVYTADFDGEGAGLHASRLVRQAHFVAKAILTIAQACDAASVHVVAHSVGGIVARAVPILYPETRPYVKTIITLSTPHAMFPYTFESSMQKFYDYIGNAEAYSADLSSPMVLSLSAGIRDELIPPDSCKVERGLSGLVVDMMPPSIAEGKGVEISLGMDHKAVSWCHNALSVVTEIIFATVDNTAQKTESRSADILGKFQLKKSREYMKDVQMEEKRMVGSYGFARSIALQATMPYRSYRFVVIYFVVAVIELYSGLIIGFNSLLITCRHLTFLPLSLAVLTVSASTLEWGNLSSTLILAYAAYIFYAAILYLIMPVFSRVCSFFNQLRRRKSSKCSEMQSVADLTIFSLVIPAVSMYLYQIVKGNTIVFNLSAGLAVLFWSATVYSFGVLLKFAAGVDGRRHPRCHGNILRLVAAWLLPTLPVAVAGKLIYALSLVSAEGQNDDLIYAQYEEREWEVNGTWSLFRQRDIIHGMLSLSIPINMLLAFVDRSVAENQN